jgi:hypothetical protein
MIPIKYIGHRPVYTDGACGSGLTFEHGQTLPVDDESARKMLRHPSVYERGDAEDSAAPAAAVVKNKATKDEDPDQTTRDTIATMTKDALVTYAKVHFAADLDKRRSVADLRTQVTGLFDQFGTE